jgi:hypothetical protein
MEAEMDEQLEAGMRTALRVNEIGRSNPYHLSFAGKGKSGASFGASQGDLAARPLARDTLWRVLAENNVPPARIASIIGQLSIPLYSNPLSTEDDHVVEQALASPAGRDLVDAMDREIMDGVCRSVGECEAAAAAAGITIDSTAAIYMGLWINMTGPPTTLKQWVSGNDVWLENHRNEIPRPRGRVTEPLIVNYLKNTDYFIANPGNFAHLQEAVAAGAAHL